MSDEMVPLAEAENEVKVVTQRLALLHLAFSRTIVDNLGWDAGKQLILDSIKQYGEYVAERTKQGHQGLPKYGFWENREDKPPLCELGKIMLELGEPELGAMYCLIDPAKTMAADPNKKMIHTRCMILGHDECQFDTIPTSDEEKESFKKGIDWSFVDPVIDEFLEES
jgi:hypothetical protein